MLRKIPQVAAATLGALLFAGCAAASADAGSVTQDDISSGATRDFGAHPAIVEIDDADHVYALSDPHGGYDALVQLLAANHLVAGPDADPTKVKWSGGAATLVIAGDLIDKGAQSLEVIDLVRSLETQAPHSGGRVIATMGNHEAEFLADPHNDKAMSTGTDADGIDEQLKAQGIDPKQLAAGGDRAGRGRWLANLPLGVRVKKWFFSHAGNTQKLSMKDLAKSLQDGIAHHGFAANEITGKDSILEAQGWYGNPDDKNVGQKEADALGVNHLVFGHDPGAFGEHGAVRASKNGVLVKLDVAMGLHAASGINPGFLLHVETKGQDKAEVLDEHGHASKLD
jgi:hypothetical protein